MNENNNSTFDSKTIVAIVLIPLIWVGWNTYLGRKYPDYNNKKAAVVQQANEQVDQDKGLNSNGSVESLPNNKAQNTAANKEDQGLIRSSEKLLSFESDGAKFSVSSFGMAIKDFSVQKYSDRSGKVLVFGENEPSGLFGIYANGEKVNFDLQQTGSNTFKGTALVGKSDVVRELTYNSEKNFFESKIVVTKGDENLKLSVIIPEKIRTPLTQSFLFPSYEKQDFYLNENGKNKSITFSNLKSDHHESFKFVSLAGISSQYFTMSLLDKSDLLPSLIVDAQVVKKEASAAIEYISGADTKSFNLNQILYIGPKGIDQLKVVDLEMPQLIDFGVFGFLARPMLYLMKSLHSLIGNWGLAIIFLTLLVRLCVMPFNIMSYRSMKGMQKIQPILAGLREKYKDDPVSLNREMYALMKVHKANPMGGCLPMLLQIPVFFALFRVIGSSIELYRSPFFGWISDLSAHDPFYVLPVLMAITMFLQQKMTPSTADPTQAKIMAFLPLVFAVFMIQLPSGLTLYMFVSGLFGITQQYLFMREKKA